MIRTVRSRLARLSVFALSLTPLAGVAGQAWGAPAPVLPSGGVLAAGQAKIGAPSGGSLTVNQSSARAIIDWSSFSIGQGGTVRFDNGAGATLNRVTGSSVSSIDGLLSASGSVYLLNPNGVLIGKSGVVDVGGSFVASTLNIGDGAFLAGGDLTFAGSSAASVINLGKVGALGGDVVLTASSVRNDGAISAPQGDVGLLAGSQVVLRDQALDGGRFAVLVGGAGTSVTNSGAIAGAMAELRANGGDVYALAGDTSGVIRATGIGTRDGRIFLTAGDAGLVSLGGTISARGPNGAGGAIETSAGTVDIGSARINAGPGGSWLLDPNDLTIDQAAANTIVAALEGGTGVTEETTASGTGGSGDINILPNVNLNYFSGAPLTFEAYRNINIGAGSSIGSGALSVITLYADYTGTGTGTVTFGANAQVSSPKSNVYIYYNPASNPAGSMINATSYTSPTDFSRLVINDGTSFNAYMLVNTANDLQNVQNNLSGTYALGRNIDASSTSSWNSGAGFQPIGSATAAARFVGLFEGQGYTVSGLTIDRPNTDGVGLFSAIGPNALVLDVSLVGANITGRYYTGALVGDDYGYISNVSVAGSVTGAGGVGGVIGVGETTAEAAGSSSATVTGTGADVGGFAGVVLGQVNASNASGAVKGGDNVGGLVGYSDGLVSTDVASGTVTGVTNVGGVVGFNQGGTRSNAQIPSGYLLDSYATGAVTGTTNVGGLVGTTSGALESDYASGAVNGTSAVGGAVGDAQLVRGSTAQSIYWDTGTSGTTVGVGSGGFLTSAGIPSSTLQVHPVGGSSGSSAYAQASYSGFEFSSYWFILEGSTRPILRTEASSTITNAHQLQLIDANLAGSYTLGANIDLSVTNNPSDVWNPAVGFTPIAAGPSNSNPFVGSLDGQGHTISNLTINASYAGVGLFGVAAPDARISNLTLTGVKVNGGFYAGALAGDNYGTISNVSVSGTVNGFGGVGGLIGVNEGGSSVTDAASAVAVAASGDDVGGLTGANLGSIAGSNASGTVMGRDSVGGLIGLNLGSVSMSSASGAPTGAGQVGPLVGSNQGSITP